MNQLLFIFALAWASNLIANGIAPLQYLKRRIGLLNSIERPASAHPVAQQLFNCPKCLAFHTFWFYLTQMDAAQALVYALCTSAVAAILDSITFKF